MKNGRSLAWLQPSDDHLVFVLLQILDMLGLDVASGIGAVTNTEWPIEHNKARLVELFGQTLFQPAHVAMNGQIERLVSSGW